MFPGSGSHRPSPLLLILVVVLGLGALVFAILTVTFYQQSSTATSTLNAHSAAAAKAAAAEQKKSDATDEIAENDSPFQSFTAPVAYGSFVIKFPKGWSSTVDEEQSDNLLTLIMNPNNILTTNGQLTPQAASVQLIQQVGTQYMQTFAGAVQAGQMTQSAITVSGQAGYNLTGTFNDGVTVREVVVPVRDQVLVFSTQNATYSSEFDEILAQCKIIP